AGPKPGNAGLAGDLAEGGVDGLVELALVDLDRDLDLVPLQGLDRRLHAGGQPTGGLRQPRSDAPAKCTVRFACLPARIGALEAWEMTDGRPEKLETAREALACHAWADAYGALGSVTTPADDPDSLELLGEAAWWVGRID